MEEVRDMATNSPNFVKVDPPLMTDDYDEEKIKEANRIKPQVFDFNLVSQDNDAQADQIKVKALIKLISNYFTKRECIIHLYLVKQLNVIDICGIIPETPGPMISEKNSYNISFIVTGAIGKIIKDLTADFDKELYIENYDLLEYGIAEQKKEVDKDCPGQQTLFTDEELGKGVSVDENL
jgi:hypothetical protein